jgi:hypothetical protein
MAMSFVSHWLLALAARFARRHSEFVQLGAAAIISSLHLVDN